MTQYLLSPSPLNYEMSGANIFADAVLSQVPSCLLQWALFKNTETLGKGLLASSQN